MEKEQLLRVTSIVNNPILDFTIVELTTNKRKINISFKFSKYSTDKYGVIYKYASNIENFCKKNNIALDIYDFNDNIDVLQADRKNPLKTFDIDIFNQI